MSPRVKHIIRKIIFLLSIPLIIGAFVFAQGSTQQEKCKRYNIRIINTEYSFVTQKDILKIIKESNIECNETNTKAINFSELESKIKENKWVKNSEVFLSANNTLNVNITQKEPVVRIQYNDSSDYGYYLDQNSNPIELNENYAPRLPIVTCPRLGYSNNDIKLKNSFVELSNYIQKDSFWNIAISQIVVDGKNQISLIPSLGNQKILIGNTENLDSKMNRLLKFYQEGMNHFPWDKYNEIDARFDKQIVCRNTHGEILSKDPYDSKSKEIVLKKENDTKENKVVVKNTVAKTIHSTTAVKKIEKPTVTTNSKNIEKVETKIVKSTASSKTKAPIVNSNVEAKVPKATKSNPSPIKKIIIKSDPK